MRGHVFVALALGSVVAFAGYIPPQLPPIRNDDPTKKVGGFAMSHASRGDYQCDKDHSFFLVAVSTGNRHYLIDVPDSFEVIRCLTADQADHIGAILAEGNIKVAKTQ